MSVIVGPEDMERVRQLIASRLGLEFIAHRVDELAQVVAGRMQVLGLANPGAYLDRLASPLTSRAELRQLAERLTIGETYFFRHGEQFRALAEVALPERLRARASTRQLRILSAGCASGEEAYTLAIQVHEGLRDPTGWKIQIQGVDINPAVLMKAARATYAGWSLRDTPAELRQRYFHFDGREYALDPAVRAMVTFHEGNLVENDDGAWPRASVDIIFCRNVIIYFSPEAIRAAIARLTAALAPGGYLFLGHAENLRGLSNQFHLCHTHDTFYYQKIDGEPARVSPWPAATPDADPSATLASDTWVESIHRATERIHAMASRTATIDPVPGTASPDQPPASTGRAWDRASVLGLIEQERFGDASAALAALPPGAADDPDARLLLAVVHINRQQLDWARRVCDRLLVEDDLNAGAHYVMALCCEQAGDLAGAVRHDRMAAHLDPSFAMPRFHMGLMARRARDPGQAALELGAALSLFAREDSARILLFGGGFNREALVRMCRAGLAASEATTR